MKMSCFVIRLYRSLLGMAVVCFGVALAGCASGPPMALQVKMLDASLMARVKFLDVALFQASLSCDNINHTNFQNTSPTFEQARIPDENGKSVLGLILQDGENKEDAETKKRKVERFIGYLGNSALLAKHPEGLVVNLFILASGTTADGTRKEPLAQGCTTFTLKRGEIVKVSVTLANLK